MDLHGDIQKHLAILGDARSVWEKDPSIAAFTDLMNRALDKPQEPKQELHVSGDWDRLAERLASARQRVARP